jgi:hypothetical protein
MKTDYSDIMASIYTSMKCIYNPVVEQPNIVDINRQVLYQNLYPRLLHLSGYVLQSTSRIENWNRIQIIDIITNIF